MASADGISRELALLNKAVSILADGEPEQWGHVALAEKKSLPRLPGVYIAATGQIVQYVGKAANLRSRWVSHHRHEQLEKIGGVSLLFISLEPHNLDAAERELIAYFKPLLNGKRIRRKCRDSVPDVRIEIVGGIEHAIKCLAARLVEMAYRDLAYAESEARP